MVEGMDDRGSMGNDSHGEGEETEGIEDRLNPVNTSETPTNTADVWLRKFRMRD